jgi:hypothetical protein
VFAALADSRSILVGGAGGGFDVYAGLPLAIALHDSGHHVHLANLAFTALELLDLDAWLDADVARIEPDTAGPDEYFPERTLARWLAAATAATAASTVRGTTTPIGTWRKFEASVE